MKTKLFKLATIVFLLSTLAFTKAYCTDNWKNNVVIFLHDSTYTYNVSVTDSMVVINKDTIESGLETDKIRDIVRKSLSLRVAKPIDPILEKTLTEMLSKEIRLREERFASKREFIQTEKRISFLEADKGENIINLSLKKSVVNAMIIPQTKKNSKTSKVKSKTSKNDSITSKNDSIISINKSNSHKAKKARVYIESLSMSIENGIIKDILAKGHSLSQDSLYYFSNQYYIPIRNAQDIDYLSSKFKNQLSFPYSGDIVIAIDLSDVLNCNRIVTNEFGTYISKDTTVTLMAGKNEIVHICKPSIIDNLNLKLFTDALGYEKKSPNGVLQTEAKLNFILNTVSSFRHRYSDALERIKDRTYRYDWIFVNRVSPYMRLMKLENNNSTLALKKDSGDVMDLFKYAYLDFGTELNVLTYRTDSKLFTANVAGGILRTKVGNDSIESNNIFVSTVYVNPNIDLKFYESNRIDFSFCVGLYGAWPIGSISKSDLINAKSKLTSYEFITSHLWGQIQQNVSFHPGGNRTNSIFIRANQYISTNNKHFTLQVGYCTSISNIIK